MSTVLIGIKMLVVIILAPLVAGIIKKTKAWLQNRRGPSIFQVYYDLVKLLNKDQVISRQSSWIFRVAPFVYFAVSLVAAALVPAGLSVTASFGDLFVLIYMFTLGRFFLALASLDAGSAFGGMGGSREMFIAVLVEPALLLAMMIVAVKAHTTVLPEMVQAAAGMNFSAAHIMAAVAFLIVVVAETGRIPVDNPDTHLELTMVHEGMVLEYSGRYLALITLATAVKQTVIFLLFVQLFLPWGSDVLAHLFAGSQLILIAKVLLVSVMIAIIETSTNKMRLFRIPGLLSMSCALSVIALML